MATQTLAAPTLSGALTESAKIQGTRIADLATRAGVTKQSMGEMIDQRIGDYEAFKEYMTVVFSRVENWLAALDPADLARVVIARPFPPQIASTFSARVAGDAGITVLDAVECWIYQHALRHMGEIEHARGLVGLHGMTS